MQLDMKYMFNKETSSFYARCRFEDRCSQLVQVTDPKEMPDVGSLQDLSKIENHAAGAGKSPKKAAPVDPQIHKFTKAARLNFMT